MPLLERIQTEMVQAMKAREEARLSALRMIKTALKKHEVDSMKPLDEAAEMQILNSLIKQRKDAAEMFRKGGRPEMADKEEAELRLIESYLPAAPSQEEMEAAVAAALTETGVTSLKQMGVVIKAAQAKLAGKRVDGKVLSDKVRSKLE
ncbi:MAG TPA: GatB/YqeY domain-containing protein [Bryobacteraceae bacterium]|nr:GatB/YqeY domain-containing protein [Bryobacteraceae bacterium]